MKIQIMEDFLISFKKYEIIHLMKSFSTLILIGKDLVVVEELALG